METDDNHGPWDWFFHGLRPRPAMYLGSKSVSGLGLFVLGIQFAQDSHQIPAEQRFPGFSMERFEAWVTSRFDDDNRVISSFQLAALLAGDERGLDLWFDWLDEFQHH